MTKPRAPRSDSVDAMVQAAKNAAKGPIKAPEHVRLRPGDLPFWHGILRSRARDEWVDADLVIAAHLAACQADIEREAALLDAEGLIVAGKVNPRQNIVEMLSKRQMAFMRTLRMGGRVAGDSRDLVKRRLLERRASEIHDELDNGLLAK